MTLARSRRCARGTSWRTTVGRCGHAYGAPPLCRLFCMTGSRTGPCVHSSGSIVRSSCTPGPCWWPILCPVCQDLNADHVASPRVFKSHESWDGVPKGAKYIYVARNPEDAFFSFYKFLPAYTGLAPDDIDEVTFANAIFAGASHSGQIWDHMLEWWERRHDQNVLFLFFEDLIDDLPQQVCPDDLSSRLDPAPASFVVVALTIALTHSSPHSLTASRTHSRTHTRTHSLTHALTHACKYARMQARTHALTSLTHALTHSLTHSLPH